MSEQDRHDYVNGALALMGYRRDAEFVAAIDAQFALIASIAATLVDTELPVELELAAVFRP